MEFGEKIEKAKTMFRQGRTRDLIWRQNQLRSGSVHWAGVSLLVRGHKL